MSEKPPELLRAAGAIGAATLLSRMMGLVREQAIAFLFGAGHATDAFNVAFRLPNLLRDLFAEGAMSASLVPIFTRTRIEEGDERAWRVAGLVFRILFGVVGILAVLGVLFAPQLVGLYASAFQKFPEKFELTVRMTRLMFPFFPLVALAAAFMGVLNACGVFFLPAFSSALFNLASVVSGVILSQWVFKGSSFYPIEGMALGVVIGGAVQAFCQLPALYRAGYRWKKKTPAMPSWTQDPALRRMLWMMLPGTLGLAATQVSILVNTILATSQGPGAVSWLNYSFRLMQFPIGIFGVALASATLPEISRLWVQRDRTAVQRTLTQTLERVFAINLPASAGLAFLGVPVIELIFQYGHFSSQDTVQTAWALAMYALGLTAYSAVKVLVPACYALGNTRAPVISSALTVVATLTLNLLLMRPLGYRGLALGTSTGAFLNAAVLLYAVKKIIVPPDSEQNSDFFILPLLKRFGVHGGLSILMGGVCWLSYRGLQLTLPDRVFLENLGKFGLPLGRFLKTGTVMAEGVLLVAVLGRLMGLTETREVVDLFLKKLKNKMSRSRK